MALTLETTTKPINRILSGHVQSKNVKHGSSSQSCLDIYGRVGTNAKPVIMFWHGGSWKNGDKAYYQFMADSIERLNAIPVIVGYPLYPQQRFPGFLDDAKQALAWVKQNIAQYGGDPNRIFVMGHSAGAHTASMLTAQDKAGDIKGCISIAGPVKLKRQYWEDVFGAETFNKGLENPVNHFTDTRHTYLLIHGKADKIVPFSDTSYFADELRKHGDSVSIIAPKKLGHMRILATIVRPFAFGYPVSKQLKTFISE